MLAPQKDSSPTQAYVAVTSRWPPEMRGVVRAGTRRPRFAAQWASAALARCRVLDVLVVGRVWPRGFWGRKGVGGNPSVVSQCKRRLRQNRHDRNKGPVFPTPLMPCNLRRVRDRHSLTSAGSVCDVSQNSLHRGENGSELFAMNGSDPILFGTAFVHSFAPHAGGIARFR